MITLPFMYGTLFCKEDDGTFRVFRLGTHGKEEISAKESIRQYIRETPINRMYHKMMVTDYMVFISDEVYQTDERNTFKYSGYMTALLGWKRIVEWAYKAGLLDEIGFTNPLGTLTLMHPHIIRTIESKDEERGKKNVPAYYNTLEYTRETTYLNTGVSLNRIDEDGIPSYRNANESGKRLEMTYNTVVCYSGMCPNIPSFTNDDVGTVGSYTYLHRYEHTDENLSASFLSFYNVTPGNDVGTNEYRSFASATMFQTPIHVLGLDGKYKIVWLDPDIGKPVRKNTFIVTKEYVESIMREPLKDYDDDSDDSGGGVIPN